MSSLRDSIKQQVYDYAMEVAHGSEEPQLEKHVERILQLLADKLPEGRKTTTKFHTDDLCAQKDLEVSGYTIEVDGTYNQAIRDIKKQLGVEK